jgi:hypothetical protein
LQAENQNFSEFFSRTEQLASKLGVRAVDLPEIMGLSKAMLFAYRKGKYPISWRAWRKLEQAEKAAGITPETKSFSEPTSLEQRVMDGLDRINERLDRIESAICKPEKMPK